MRENRDMKLNLRKAASVQTSIKSAISERQALLTGEMTMELWAVNDELLAVARGNQLRAVEEIERLEQTLSSIREQVGAANVKCGVNKLLSEQAVVAAQISRLSRLSKSTPMPTSAQLAERAKGISAANEKSAYRVTDSFSVSVFSSNDIERFTNKLVSLRRRQTAIGEELITANITTEITIRDQDWTWLESLGIV